MNFKEAREKELEELKMWRRDVEIAGVDFPFGDQCNKCKFLKLQIVKLPVHKKMLNGTIQTYEGPKVVCCEHAELCNNALDMNYRMRIAKKKRLEEAKK